MNDPIPTDTEILRFKRWNTPTTCNGWEQITRRDIARECFKRVTDAVSATRLLG